MSRKKIGNIYKFKIQENLILYFQYIGSDKFQLNSDCILIFRFKDSGTEKDLKKIIDSGIWLITLTWINNGIQNNYYEEVGHYKPQVNPDEVYFKSIQKHVWDMDSNTYSDIYYKRLMNSNNSEYYKNLKEYEESTINAWDEGATPAQGLRRWILYKFFNIEVD